MNFSKERNKKGKLRSISRKVHAFKRRLGWQNTGDASTFKSPFSIDQGKYFTDGVNQYPYKSSTCGGFTMYLMFLSLIELHPLQPKMMNWKLEIMLALTKAGVWFFSLFNSKNSTLWACQQRRLGGQPSASEFVSAPRFSHPDTSKPAAVPRRGNSWDSWELQQSLMINISGQRSTPTLSRIFHSAHRSGHNGPGTCLLFPLPSLYISTTWLICHLVSLV